MDELKVFTGNAHPGLAQAVVDYLGIPLGKCEVFQFNNENFFVRIQENMRSPCRTPDWNSGGLCHD